jgi:hypothetical protein
MIAGARVVLSESRNWPPGGAALAIRNWKVIVLLRPGLSRPEKKSALKWARGQLQSLRHETLEFAPAEMEVSP